MVKVLTIFASVLLGIFLTFIAMTVADKGGLPEPISWIFAPGDILIRIFPGIGFRVFELAFFSNVALYTFLSYIFLRKLTRDIRLPKSQNFWTQP